MPEQEPKKPERLNFGDSLGFLALLLGTWLVIIVPPLLIKIPLMFCVCVGAFLFVRRSRWTHGWPLNAQYGSASIFCLVVLATGIPQFVSQWKQEHSFPLSIQAWVSTGHNANEMMYAIKWQPHFKDIRLTIDDATEYPVQNLDLTVQVLENSGDALFGMGQVSDVAGVKFTAPEWPETGLELQGTNGEWVRVEPSDYFPHMAFGNHWKMFCPIVPAGVHLKLAIASLNNDSKSAPKKLRLLGTYEVKTNEGDRVSAFDRVVTVR